MRPPSGGAVADAAPSVIVNCAAFNDVDGAEDRPARRACGQRVGRAQPGAGRRGRAAPRSCTTAPTSSSMATADEPYDEEAPPSPRSAYAASKLLGEWFALDAPRGVRAARREPVRHRRAAGPAAAARSTASSTASSRAARCGCSPIASCRRATSPDVAAATRHLVDAGARAGPVSLRQRRAGDVARGGARRRRGCSASTPRLGRSRWTQVQLKAARPRFCALANRQARPRPDSRCRRGRTRSRRWLAAATAPAA